MEKAYKVLDEEGRWQIYFNPQKKMHTISWSKIEGFIDKDMADKIVKFLKGLK